MQQTRTRTLPAGGFGLSDGSLDAAAWGAAYALPLLACSAASRLPAVRSAFPVLEELQDATRDVVRPLVAGGLWAWDLRAGDRQGRLWTWRWGGLAPKDRSWQGLVEVPGRPATYGFGAWVQYLWYILVREANRKAHMGSVGTVLQLASNPYET